MSQTAHHHTPHILPLSIYLGIGSLLIVLTAVTVYVSFFNFGPYNLLVAMIIAAFKASLVALFFMHLKYDNKLYMFFFLGSLFFLAVFIIITMFDTMRRGDLYEIKAGPINKNAAMYDSLKTSVHDDSSLVDSLEMRTDTVDVVIDSTK